MPSLRTGDVQLYYEVHDLQPPATMLEDGRSDHAPPSSRDDRPCLLMIMGEQCYISGLVRQQCAAICRLLPAGFAASLDCWHPQLDMLLQPEVGGHLLLHHQHQSGMQLTFVLLQAETEGSPVRVVLMDNRCAVHAQSWRAAFVAQQTSLS